MIGGKIGIFAKTIKNFDSNHGVTLLELVIAAALVGFIGILVAAIYFANFRLFSNQNTSIDVSGQNALALNDIANQIRQSQKVVSNCPGSAYSTGANVVSVQLFPIDASANPIDNGTFDCILYRLDLAKLQLIKTVVPTAGPPASSRKSLTKIVATNVNNLQFTYDNADPTLASQVTINLTTRAVTSNKTHLVTQSTQAVLRNK